VDTGMLAWVTIGVPYILTFYIALALLEDTGYLNKIAFLSDNVMHKLGLHGRALITLLTGLGCNVPAIMGTRVLTTKREKLLASTLIVLTPCSARTAVILGAVALFVGWQYAVLIYLFELGLILLVGFGLNKVLPGESSGLVMEMFPFRVPSVSTVLKKTWYRFKEFICIAAPLIMIGSLILGVLYETKYIWMIANPMSPITTLWLGLPALVGIPLILGVFRKELTLELLIALAVMQYGVGAKNLLLFMTPIQIFIFALVITIYIPCVATISVLGKEVGWKNTLLITVFTIMLALFIGGIAYRLVSFFT
jgi:ferrous iron transport protein B